MDNDDGERPSVILNEYKVTQVSKLVADLI